MSADLDYGKFGFIRERVQKAIAETAQGDLRGTLRVHGLEEHISSIKKTLEPFRCGKLKRKEFMLRGGPLYTRDELSWFVSADTGMYTAVNGTVYDLTGKLHPHLFLSSCRVLCFSRCWAEVTDTDRLRRLASRRAESPPRARGGKGRYRYGEEFGMLCGWSRGITSRSCHWEARRGTRGRCLRG